MRFIYLSWISIKLIIRAYYKTSFKLEEVSVGSTSGIDIKCDVKEENLNASVKTNQANTTVVRKSIDGNCNIKSNNMI